MIVRQKKFASPTIVAIIAGILTVALTPSLKSSPITFAEFQQPPSGATTDDFAYLNDGAASDAELVSEPVAPAGVPILFDFLSTNGILPADLQGAQAAILSLTSSTTSAVATAFGGSVGDEQTLGSGQLADVLSITRNTPAAEGNGSRNNLLTMTFTGQLFGALGGHSPQLAADTNFGYVVTYSSDFLKFTGATQQNNFTLNFTSWTTTAADANNGNGLEIAADNYFESAIASGSATFESDSVAVLPEPLAIALMCLAAPILLSRGLRPL